MKASVYLIFLTSVFLFACSKPHLDLEAFSLKSFGIVSSSTPEADEQSLSPATYLRKLSLHLRGFPPDVGEYQALSALTPEQTEDFLKNKIQEYLHSREHVEKMNFRLNELFYMQQSAFPHDLWHGLTTDDMMYRNTFSENNAMNDLFRDIVGQNLSWDQLLTGKSYHIKPNLNQFEFRFISDLNFFRSVAGNLMPDLPPTYDRSEDFTPFILKFSVSDERIAGTLTTTRFFDRNVTTAVNQNRRRAAAIFRIFLCDEMKAVAVDQKGDQKPIYDLAFPDDGHANLSEDQIRAQVDENKRHGDDPACNACHYKLDPMGQTFRQSTMLIAPHPSKGALVYKRQDGSLVNIPVTGLGPLAQALTQQPEYVNCQIRHFWNWFVGEDIPLTNEKQQELAIHFNESGRRVNDFIAYLVTLPEFRMRHQESEDSLRARQVKAIFKNCNSCHLNPDGSREAPDFNDWPINGSKAGMERWIQKINKALDLDGDGQKAKMPPPESQWRPSAEERAILKNWISLGAPNEKGEPQIGGH